MRAEKRRAGRARSDGAALRRFAQFPQGSSRDHPPSRMRRQPAVAKSGVVVDGLELGIDVAEFFADSLDEGADTVARARIAVFRCDVLAANEIVDLPVGDVVPGAKR